MTGLRCEIISKLSADVAALAKELEQARAQAEVYRLRAEVARREANAWKGVALGGEA